MAACQSPIHWSYGFAPSGRTRQAKEATPRSLNGFPWARPALSGGFGDIDATVRLNRGHAVAASIPRSARLRSMRFWGVSGTPTRARSLPSSISAGEGGIAFMSPA
jgi:hypothetical protein